jgi:cytochrome bd-type quinol oxidase subunit 2
MLPGEFIFAISLWFALALVALMATFYGARVSEFPSRGPCQWRVRVYAQRSEPHSTTLMFCFLGVYLFLCILLYLLHLPLPLF